jgi:hypothetical protein
MPSLLNDYILLWAGCTSFNAVKFAQLTLRPAKAGLWAILDISGMKHS